MRSVVSLSTLTALAVYLSGVNAIVPKPPPSDDVKEAQVSYKGSATFEQLIDHNNPDLGTFSQRYWWSSEFWAGEGSPVSQRYTFVSYTDIPWYIAKYSLQLCERSF